jgi:predicted  nucleic acid-binding Zn-ribbon protein
MAKYNKSSTNYSNDEEYRNMVLAKEKLAYEIEDLKKCMGTWTTRRDTLYKEITEAQHKKTNLLYEIERLEEQKVSYGSKIKFIDALEYVINYLFNKGDKEDGKKTDKGTIT